MPNPSRCLENASQCIALESTNRDHANIYWKNWTEGVKVHTSDQQENNIWQVFLSLLLNGISGDNPNFRILSGDLWRQSEFQNIWKRELLNAHALLRLANVVSALFYTRGTLVHSRLRYQFMEVYVSLSLPLCVCEFECACVCFFVCIRVHECVCMHVDKYLDVSIFTCEYIDRYRGTDRRNDRERDRDQKK